MPLDGASPPDLVRSVRDQKSATPLYVNRIKVYPKAVSGVFRRLKWTMLALCLTIYYVTPWLRWDRGPGAPSQAVLLDLPGERFYFFMVEIWPQEIYFLAGLMILGAMALFLASSLFGRVWCGFTCPQTVWTDLFMWVERAIEGDRNARLKLDREAWSARKAALKTSKHAAWLMIAVATGGAWVFYYTDAPTALTSLVTGRASLELYFFVGLFTATTYLLAGWAREQVCTFMCPWPRFQAAMFDEGTFVVTYKQARGEPRGPHKAGQSWDGRGDCVDCRQCVAACPTGIDIRDGQQMECIGCGLCIDACNTIMDKVGRPQGLIAFATLASHADDDIRYRLVRPRTVLYGSLVLLVAVVIGGAFLLRTTVELSVLRDRAPLFVTLSDGAIRNGYTLRVLNKTRTPQNFEIATAGLPQASISLVAAGDDARSDSRVVTLRPDSVATYRVYVASPRASLSAESTPLSFRLLASDGRIATQHATVFLAPNEDSRK